jgi:hypothetical protein
MRRLCLVLLSAGVMLASPSEQTARAEDLPPKYLAVADKGLRWLAQQQHADGHWEARGTPFAAAMTGMAGLVLLMEGSTLHEGRYAQHLRRAVHWLIVHSQPNGLIGEVAADIHQLHDLRPLLIRRNGQIEMLERPPAGPCYMYGHGFALLFLAQVYGEEGDADRRRQLGELLTQAVQFTCRTQTSTGGWGYVAACDGDDFDEASVSVAQVQALRAAKNAGIPVPAETIDKAYAYLAKCTTPSGGAQYSLASKGTFGGFPRPSITVAAIASMFSLGEYTSPLAKKWLRYVRFMVPLETVGSDKYGYSEYTHYYYAQVIYLLGEDGYERLYPDTNVSWRLTWSEYKRNFFAFLARTQNKDGSWTSTAIGEVYTTSLYLTILQLEKGALPFYQR